MTIQSLKEQVEAGGGEFSLSQITFKLDAEGQLEAHDELGDNRCTFFDIKNNDKENNDAYIGAFGANYLSDYAKERNFLIRLAEIIDFDLGLNEKVEVTRPGDTKIERVEVEIIPEKIERRLSRYDRNCGMIEAYEKILLRRDIQIEGRMREEDLDRCEDSDE